MQSRDVTRRFMLIALGSGIALAPAAVNAATSGSDSAPDKQRRGPEAWSPGTQPLSLFRGLAAGSVVAGCTVLGIGDLVNGAVGLALRDRSGARFGVEVCARDAASPRGPAETERFALYVVNEGDGSIPTTEEHGLAAMAIAQVVRANEASVATAGFLTLNERLARHAATIIRPD